MLTTIRQLATRYKKPLFFGIYGGLGCLLAALLFGEIFLNLTQLPPSVEKTPQAIALLIDTSSSMEGSKLAEVKSAAINFVQRQGGQRDSLAVISFSNGAQVVSRFGSDTNTLVQGIAGLSANGGTNMSAGIDAALAETQSTVQKSRNILLFTDGVPNSLTAANTSSLSARIQGVNVVAVGTGGADVNFLSQLTGNSALVFFANSGQLDGAFKQAEKAIYGKQLVESGRVGDYNLVYSLLRIGGWTGLLAIGVSLALIVGQNIYLRRRIISPKEFLLGTLAGGVAGAGAGAIGQFLFLSTNVFSSDLISKIISCVSLGLILGIGFTRIFAKSFSSQKLILGGVGGAIGSFGHFMAIAILGTLYGNIVIGVICFFVLGKSPWLGAGTILGVMSSLLLLLIPSFPVIDLLTRIIGWGLLGVCLGGSMSLFIPNLKLNRALLGGLLGGAIGSLGFLAFAFLLGDIAGRLIGAAILGFFIGIMIALLEALSRQPQLVINWSKSEPIKIAIGRTPIVMGSSSEAHVHLPRNQGFPPIVAKIREEEGKIIMEYSEAMRERGMKVLRFELKHGDKRKLGDVMIALEMADNPETRKRG
jgi:Ca-activated chloride channel family protein